MRYFSIDGELYELLRITPEGNYRLIDYRTGYVITRSFLIIGNELSREAAAEAIARIDREHPIDAEDRDEGVERRRTDPDPEPEMIVEVVSFD